MKYAITIQSADPETVWNAFRFACAAITRGHTVSAFLLGPAVEIDSIKSPNFDVKKIVDRFLSLGGEALSCGTCLRIRKRNASESCPLSTMDTFVRLTEEADRTLVFG